MRRLEYFKLLNMHGIFYQKMPVKFDTWSGKLIYLKYFRSTQKNVHISPLAHGEFFKFNKQVKNTPR